MRSRLLAPRWVLGAGNPTEYCGNYCCLATGLHDVHNAMIPKVDADSTPLGQRLLCVLPVIFWLWASLRSTHLRDWVEGWFPESATFGVNASRAIPLLTFTKVNKPIILNIFQEKEKEKKKKKQRKQKNREKKKKRDKTKF